MDLKIRRIAAPSRFLIESAIVHAGAEQHLDPGHRRLLVLSIPHLRSHFHTRLIPLMQTLPDRSVDWIILSDRGGLVLHLPTWNIFDLVPDQGSSRRTAPDEMPPSFEFSDAVGWLLKVLLLSRIETDRAWWEGHRGQIRSGKELAECSGVSPSMVYRVMDQLRERQWLGTERDRPIRILQPRALLDAWTAQHRHRAGIAIPVRPLFDSPSADPEGVLDWLASRTQDEQGTCRWAVNGWMACRINGTAFVTDIDRRPITLACVGKFQQLIDDWQLMRCEDARDALFHLEPVKSVRSIPNGICQATRAAGVLPVVDIIQSALDVVRDPARGPEQAEHTCRVVTEAYEAIDG